MDGDKFSVVLVPAKRSDANGWDAECIHHVNDRWRHSLCGDTLSITNIQLLFGILTIFYLPLFEHILSPTIFSSSSLQCVCTTGVTVGGFRQRFFSMSSLNVHNKFEVPTCSSAMVAMTVSTSRSMAISPHSIVRFVLCLSSSCSSCCQHCRTSSLRCVTRFFP